MNNNRYLKTFIFAIFSLLIINVNTASAASAVEDAVSSWMQTLKDLGATVAKYDEIRVDEAADTATIENMQIDWKFSIPDSKASFAMSYRVGQILLKGFKEEADGYSIESYSISDDNKFNIDGLDNKGLPIQIEGITTGVTAQGMFYPKFTPVPEDPQHPISRYLHLYDLFLKVIVKKSAIEKITMTQSVEGKPFLNVEYNGIVTKGLANGRIEEMRFDSYKQVFTLPDESGNDVPFDKIETTYGVMLQRGIDFGAIVRALKGTGDGPDGEYSTVFEEASVSDVKVSAGPVNLNMEGYRLAGVKIRPGKKSVGIGPTKADCKTLKRPTEMTGCILLSTKSFTISNSPTFGASSAALMGSCGGPSLAAAIKASSGGNRILAIAARVRDIFSPPGPFKSRPSIENSPSPSFDRF